MINAETEAEMINAVDVICCKQCGDALDKAATDCDRPVYRLADFWHWACWVERETEHIENTFEKYTERDND